MNKENPFTEKCICNWSKDDEYGFVRDINCSVHGKGLKDILEECVECKTEELLEA